MYGELKKRIEEKATGLKLSKGMLILMALAVFALSPVEAVYLDNVTTMIEELPDLLDAIADMIPAIARMLIMLAVVGLVTGIFGAIVYKIKQKF